MAITKGDTTYSGLIEIDGKLACEGCKTVNPAGKQTMHMDFTDKYMSNYECFKCGNSISVTTKRDKESAAMWAD